MKTSMTYEQWRRNPLTVEGGGDTSRAAWVYLVSAIAKEAREKARAFDKAAARAAANGNACEIKMAEEASAALDIFSGDIKELFAIGVAPDTGEAVKR